jgi:hypothetical protein
LLVNVGIFELVVGEPGFVSAFLDLEVCKKPKAARPMPKSHQENERFDACDVSAELDVFRLDAFQKRWNPPK